MRDSIEEDLFRAIACTHVQHGDQIVFELERSTWTVCEESGRYILKRDTVPISETSADVRTYANVDAAVGAFVEQLSLQGKNFTDAIFKRVVMGRLLANAELKVADSWGVTWRHLVARLDVLRMLLLDDKSIMARIFEEAKNL